MFSSSVSVFFIKSLPLLLPYDLFFSIRYTLRNLSPHKRFCLLLVSPTSLSFYSTHFLILLLCFLFSKSPMLVISFQIIFELLSLIGHIVRTICQHFLFNHKFRRIITNSSFRFSFRNLDFIDT
uniref:Uncharacterized protein n=1 Tax=Cacopsylla melanoneura TaxID=428564 RepID=A0A8D8SDD4_9HEMI